MRRCIHDKTERQRCAKCNVVDGQLDGIAQPVDPRRQDIDARRDARAEVEITRLRRIEEAARLYLDTDGSGALYDAHLMLIARAALRAAIAQAKEASDG